jgi:protein tyrosine phosphatase (PTP) superfamily phosphohydrolase (DUF442 family)
MRIILAVVAASMLSSGATRALAAEPVSTKNIRNYVSVNEQYATGGQPSEEQLKALSAEGFKTIINLATINPRYSLADEGASVRALGMTYHHIPVDWDKPTDADFKAFEAAMQAAPKDKTLVHCAANFRATAFYSLYAMKHLGWSQAEAEKLRASVWTGSNYPVWQEFIARHEAQIIRN